MCCFFSGKLLKAEYILSSLISNNGATGKVLSYLHNDLHPPSLPEFQFKNNLMGTSLVVQWLRLHAPNAVGQGSIPGQETKIPHTATEPAHRN